MRHLPIVILSAALIGYQASRAQADELDAWCAQVKKASSIVICSDADLRQQTAARQRFFDRLRETLAPDTYKSLMADQTRWVKSYTAGCGVPLDGAVPTMPIPQSVIECYRDASRRRNNYLVSEFGSATAKPNLPSAAAAVPPAATPPRKPQWELAMDAWYGCLSDAVDALAGEPEPAQTVVDAAFGSCTKAEEAFRESGNFDFESIAKLKSETVSKQAVARVMAIRAAVSKLREKSAPTEKTGPSPAIDYNRM